MLLARLRATHRPLKSPHISLPLSLSPSLAHTRPPLAQRKPASHDHSPAAPLPRRPARFQPILAICSTNCCSLPPPAQELGRATASCVSVDSHIACIPALPSGALQSCPRVLDMNIIRTHAARSDLPWFQRVIPVVVYSGHLIYARRAFDRDVHVESSS